MQNQMRLIANLGLLLLVVGCYLPLHQRYILVKEHNAVDFNVQLLFTFPENQQVGLIVKEEGRGEFGYLDLYFPDPTTYTDVSRITIRDFTFHLSGDDMHIELETNGASDEWLEYSFSPTQQCLVPFSNDEVVTASFEVIIYSKHAQAAKHYFVEATLEEINKIEWKYKFID